MTPLCEPLVTSQLLIGLVELKAVGSAKAGLVFALKDHRLKDISNILMKNYFRNFDPSHNSKPSIRDSRRISDKSQQQ